MEITIVMCKNCQALYVLGGNRYYCPVCSGEPISLEGTLAVIAPEAAPQGEEKEPSEPAPVEEEPEAPQEPPPAEKKGRKKA